MRSACVCSCLGCRSGEYFWVLLLLPGGGAHLRESVAMLRGLLVARGVGLVGVGGAPWRRLGTESAARVRWRPPRGRLVALGGALALALGVKLAVAAAEKEEEEGAEPEPRPLKGGFSRAVQRSRDLLQRVKDEAGAPGIVIGVSVDGRDVWLEGLGYADVENRVPCKPETVLRIASISKSLTMAAALKLWEEGKLDLDAPVQKYVPEFPEKEFEGKKVTITTRLLASHLSGIRHYEKDVDKVKEEKEKFNRALRSLKESTKSDQREKDQVSQKSDEAKAKSESEGKSAKCQKKKKEFEQEEYYLKDKFEDVIESLNLFKNDPLFFRPGSQYLYSTHGFTLLGAVVERAAGHKFTDYMLKIFLDLDMLATELDDNESLIYNRARYYILNKKNCLANAPYVDNSYKWAGGGFVSTVGDLLKFGNAMLYGYQLGQLKNLTPDLLPGYLKPSTIAMMWTAVPNTELSWRSGDHYGLAWRIVEKKQEYGFCRQQRHYTTHSGAAIGASSVLLILPEDEDSGTIKDDPLMPPRGVVVSIICNMQSVSLRRTALNIALEFEKDKLADNAYKSNSLLD